MKKKAATLQQWEKLYEVTQLLKAFAPWDFLGSDDLVAIQLEKTPVEVFCSVLGGLGECYGISVFVGVEGLRDFRRLRDIKQDKQSSRYVMMDHTSLTLYWGDREETPPPEKAVIKQLGLKFRGRGNWPYFLSYQHRYAPDIPDGDQVALLIEALQNLFMVVRGIVEGRIPLLRNEGDMLLRIYDKKDALWKTFWAPLPDIPNSYPTVTLSDELLEARLKKAPRNSDRIIMDLMYYPQGVVGEDGGRDYYPLVLIMLDEGRDLILEMELLEPERTEIDAVVTAFVNYVVGKGRMKQIKARNPWVHATLADICQKCQIPLIHASLPKIDKIMQEIARQ